MGVVFYGHYPYLYQTYYQALGPFFFREKPVLLQIHSGVEHNLLDDVGRQSFIDCGFEIVDLGNKHWRRKKKHNMRMLGDLIDFYKMIMNFKLVKSQARELNMDTLILDSDLSMISHLLYNVSQEMNSSVFIVQTCLADFLPVSYGQKRLITIAYRKLSQIAKDLVGLGNLKNKQTQFGCEFDNAHVLFWGKCFQEMNDRYNGRSSVVGNIAFDYIVSSKADQYMMRNLIHSRKPKVLICTDAIHEVLACKEELVIQHYEAIVDLMPEIDFIFKVHPREDKEKYRVYFQRYTNVSIDEGNTLYELFNTVDVQLSFMSTTSIEALVYDLPIVLLQVKESTHITDYQEKFFKSTALFADCDDPEAVREKVIEGLQVSRYPQRNDRRLGIEVLLGKLDGNSSRRTAEVIQKQRQRNTRQLVEKFASDTIILCVGQDYNTEAKKVLDWILHNGKADDSYINYAYAIKGLISNRTKFEVPYYKDVIDQKMESNLFNSAYNYLIELIADCNLKNSPDFSLVMDTYYHTIAAEIFKFKCFEYNMNNSHIHKKRHIAIMDFPFNFDVSEYFISEGIKFVWLNDEEIKYPYNEVTLCSEEVLAAYELKFENEIKNVGSESPFRRPTTDNAPTNSILVVSDDSGSRINSISRDTILRALEENGYSPVFLTSTSGLENDKMCSNRRFKTPFELCRKDYVKFIKSLENSFNYLFILALENTDITDQLFFITLKPRLYGYLKTIMASQSALDYLDYQYGFKDILAIGESNFLSILTIKYFNEKSNFRTWGVSPVLYMDHPTCSYWLAQRHFVYGTHGKAQMVKNGVPEHSILVVGTEHFDRCLRRELQYDLKLVGELLSGRYYQKLIIVATENRPRQMIEIEATLDVVSKMENVLTVLKLHPSDDLEFFRRFVDDKCFNDRVLVVKDFDSLALLNSSDLLLTMGSNLIIEAALLGKLSLSYNFSGISCPIDFVSEGLCFGVTNSKDLYELIMQLLYDESKKSVGYAKLGAIDKFNGPNDGKSSLRIVETIRQVEGERDEVFNGLS